MKFTSSLKLKLIYVFRINDEAHKGCLKIGEATSDNEDIWGLEPNSKALNRAAKKRIDQYTQTAGIAYDLLYTELAIFNDKSGLKSFSDHEIHNIFTRSGIKKKTFDTKNKANEWFVTDLETVKKAIKAFKEGKDSLHASEITETQNPIVFRPEQKDAIEKTIKQFKKGNEMLWFAKMRFGKTLSALQLVKEHEFTRTLILTHRPVVDKGWFEDFGKIFYDSPQYSYGSKNQGNQYATLEKACKANGTKYIYFASMQDLRGSEKVGGNFNKNDEIFGTFWDFIIVDEAHEGTQTDLGKNVVDGLKKVNTKILHLSGTPFNLLDNYKEEELYTWDYVMEQKAKAEWDQIHLGDPNPYASLPKLNIFTYDLGKLINGYIDEEVAFNFREFFRVNEAGAFLHEKDVISFLNLICKEDSTSNYPYATTEYRDNFRHSLWMVPGVKEAKALSKMLKLHPVFGQFEIVNVAGDGDEEEAKEESLKKVEKAIGDKPHETYTITLSCGRLTTGVSVKAWTAVFMLSGSHNTSASGYMQTIFRVQTPATINGMVKEECFVFDFAPDRTLKVIAETAKVSAKAGKTTGEDRKIMGEFLNFCPIISIDGSQMRSYDVNGMLEQLKKVYVERVVRNGFEDGYLYNDDQLKNLESVELEEFEGLKKIIGTTKAMPKSGDIDVNKQGFTNEEIEQLENIKKKKKEDLSEEEKQLLAEKFEKKKNRDSAVSILRGISIRMPLLIYGADVNNEENEISIDNFTELVDNQSWEEFMPKGVTKQTFLKFKKYYEPDVFRAAGKRIRALARAADHLPIEDRIERITSIFATFRNPDKETVLTPWRVVNMHLGDCLGGYVFLDEKRDKTIANPVFITQSEVTANVFAPESRVLEINSKSGLYPLYVAYSIFRNRVSQKYPDKEVETLIIEEQQQLWDETLLENIFVICKTPMAKSITKRTLAGFRNAKVNTRFFEDLVHQITHRPEDFISKVKKGQSFWKTNNDNEMKFNAIVGNPPYQEMDGGNSESAKPVYQHFVDIAKKIKPDYFSMIMPARWYAGGKGLDAFRESMLNDNRMSHLFDFPNSNDCFTNVDIAGGLCYFLWDKNYAGNCTISNNINGEINSAKRSLNEFEILIRDNKAISIINKVLNWNKESRSLFDRVSSSKPFGIRGFYIPKKSGIPCYFTQRIGLQYADENDITDKFDLLDKWKLLLPKSPIAGQTDFTKPVGFYYDGNIRIAKPGECCTETYIVAGAFDKEEEVLSFKSYVFTKLVRFLLLQMVISQDVTKRCFGFIPDLTKYEGTYTDKQLCSLWGITNEEWTYIDSRVQDIKPMAE
ncbi:Eco57I restriction-modification methylase [Pedobacter glucosidilyticus]|uniref:DEAD/DEAH box helicase n=1 Tax=Pedobacter aquae TaxID=2605747 RepID=A0A5C0VJ20_9SPHI|nr:MULTISPECIES: Eco57I restriction-modification methylase domain-containing protein [Pedobacter]KHJ36860.1 Eco57I restriction-modification methylase [Pedobacter glucosidilyticus]QEK52069.1 DEAD/DEAH box helicase [Pedobacter aquae]